MRNSSLLFLFLFIMGSFAESQATTFEITIALANENNDRGQLENAKTLYGKALSLATKKSDSIAALGGLSQTNYVTGSYADATKYLTILKEVSPNNKWATRTLKYVTNTALLEQHMEGKSAKSNCTIIGILVDKGICTVQSTVDGMPVIVPKRTMYIYGCKVLEIVGWSMDEEGPCFRVPVGTSPPEYLKVALDIENADVLPKELRENTTIGTYENYKGKIYLQVDNY